MRHRMTKIFCIMALVGVFTLASTLAVVANAQYDLYFSQSANRTNPKPLDGATVSGDIAVFVRPTGGVTRVSFYLDNVLYRVENYPEFDFEATAPNGSANLWDTTQVADGHHVISAVIKITGGTDVEAKAGFTVDNIPFDELQIIRIEAWGATAYLYPPGQEFCASCPEGYYATGGEASTWSKPVSSYRGDATTWCTFVHVEGPDIVGVGEIEVDVDCLGPIPVTVHRCEESGFPSHCGP